VRGDSVFGDDAGGTETYGFDQLIGDDPTPEFLTILADEHQRRMNLLENDILRQIALWKMEGYTNEEIADRLKVTCRSVERKLRRIREAWAEEVEV
jgi:DNA-directed RNA polymerase specialized sigma24 family protein